MAEEIISELTQSALEQLSVDEDFRQLESQFAEFNIFEAIGVVHQELRHSDFLAFLLNPRQNHGQEILRAPKTAP